MNRALFNRSDQAIGQILTFIGAKGKHGKWPSVSSGKGR
jgi:hypothetical protein